ncbi:MAG: bifunctional folylpolyglutamate synthase/dihydrofolate synthase, partial [Deinococcus sp.]|nr:bifunctional folylpolyglutamate synthase/dihydrofolate synthase [Deinococcus sp.]
AVVEVGMGGRLDPTNTVQSLVSIITNVALEHTEALGHTVERIAFEKAGILRPGVPAVTGALGPALAEILRCANDSGTPLWAMDHTQMVLGGNPLARGHQLTGLASSCWGLGQPHLNGRRPTCPAVPLPLLGAFQAQNATLAAAALQLQEQFPISSEQLRRGLAAARWPGRLEILPGQPDIVLDAAHNGFEVAALVDSLHPLVAGRELWTVFGVMRTKDYQQMLALLHELQPQFVLTHAPTERGAEPELLLPFCPGALVAPSTTAALELALERAPADAVVLVTGSIYVVGEAIQHLTALGRYG